MPRPFLIIQLRPEDEAADSELAAILRYGNLHQGEVIRLRAERYGVPEVKLDEYSGIIVGGSPFEVSTPEEDKSEVQKRIEAGFRTLLPEVVARDFPFLGCCSGCGILGSHQGVSLSGRYSEPVGAVDVTLTEAGKADPLLSGLPGTFRAFVGHKEACDAVPPGATLLASTEQCPVHIFRVGENVYATQFHPEGDTEGFLVRIRVYREHGYFPAERAEELSELVTREKTPVAQKVLERFVSRYRSSG